MDRNEYMRQYRQKKRATEEEPLQKNKALSGGTRGPRKKAEGPQTQGFDSVRAIQMMGQHQRDAILKRIGKNQ